MKINKSIAGMMGGLEAIADEEADRFTEQLDPQPEPESTADVTEWLAKYKQERGGQMVDKMVIGKTYEELIGTIEDAELKELIEAQRHSVRGRPKCADEKGPEQWVQFTASGRIEYLDKVKEISRSENVMIKDIIDVALKNYLKAYERKHGEIVVRKHTGPKNADDLI